MGVGVLQVFTVEWAGKGNLALGTATDRADVALDCGACPPCASFPADFAKHLSWHELPLLSDQRMKRVDLYIKVELELEEEEKTERVAGEICRQLEKLYMVHRAEVSNVVARE